MRAGARDTTSLEPRCVFFFFIDFYLMNRVFSLGFKHDNVMPATTTPNESIQLVGGSPNTSTLDIGTYDHQRVFMTRWWVFTAISATPGLYRPQRVNTTRWWVPSTRTLVTTTPNDHQRVFMTRWWVFTAISATPHATVTPVSTAPNESIRLVGGCQPPGRWSLQPPTSLFDSKRHAWCHLRAKTGLNDAEHVV